LDKPSEWTFGELPGFMKRKQIGWWLRSFFA
jgi:hypothetical protein